MERRHRTIGLCVDECIRNATEEWYRQNAGYRSREEAFANDFRLVTTTVERRPGGMLIVHVGIITRDRNTTIQDCWKYQYRDRVGYVQEAHS